ncbi:hypothetical protein SBF1_800050 [Candidatus Desulfosporosinus infrequens]|uniref:Uncharacterized protein n=1 Tax=Candidatus Desulfosporosinus infrequens TaxID=2043169 RepID=A0A2U3LSZ6_9FIRM|nr:hypothetical protein SBF1_800050 [Candidatus Desulfosporosinus infrequens]
MAKMRVVEEVIIINYLKATGLNRPFISFGEYQLVTSDLYFRAKNIFFKSVLICVICG